MTIENEQNQVQPEVDEIEVEVTENEASSDASNEDELENYTKSVSKRINKLNALPNAAPIKNKGVTSPPLKPALSVKTVKTNFKAKTSAPC